MKNKLQTRIYVEEGTLLEHLEEVGSIKVDFISEEVDLDLLVEVLDEDYNLPCYYQHVVGEHLLINEHYEENK